MVLPLTIEQLPLLRNSQKLDKGKKKEISIGQYKKKERLTQKQTHYLIDS